MFVGTSLSEETVPVWKSNLCQGFWVGGSDEVVLPSKPALRNIGGGKRQFFDPVTRIFREVEVPTSQGVFFNAINKQGEAVFLGEGKSNVTKDGEGIIYTSYSGISSAYLKHSRANMKTTE